jgi:VWFA-related protein
MLQMSRHCSSRKTVAGQIHTAWQIVLWSIAVPAPLACGQAPQQPAVQAVDSSVNAGQISLDLVVHDKKDRPVLDLKPGDIAVTDGDSPVTLSSLRLVTGNQEGEHLITLVFNRPAQGGGSHVGAVPSWLKSERETAEKILKMIPENGYSVSVLSVDGRLRLVQQFTSDRNAVVQAVNAATGPATPASGNGLSPQERELSALARTGSDSSGKPASVRDRALAQTLFSALVDSGRIAQDQHMRPSLAGLLALMQSQQQLAHRKVVIYFTSPNDRQIDSSAKGAIQSIIGTANRTGVSVYIVDLNSADRGSDKSWAGAQAVASAMQQSVNMHSEAMGSSAGSSNFSSEMQSSARRMQTEGLDPNLKQIQSDMSRLAEETGGSYVTGDTVRKSTERMIQDMTAYYEAVYLSPVKEYDGKFRPVAVKPLRTGLKIRSQAGYLAEPPSGGNGAAPQPFELPLLKILSQPQLPADVAFRAAILRIGDTPDGSIHVLAIEAPLSNLEVRGDSSTNLSLAHISIVVNVKDKTGAVLEHFSADIPRRGVLKNIAMAKYEVIGFERHFVVPPGQYVLEAAILDRNSGKAGAQRVPFEVPNPSAMPSLSSVILVRAPEPLHAEDDSSDPLRYGNERVTPNLSGVLPPGARDVSVFFVVHSDPHAAQTPTVNLQVLKDGKPLGGAPVISRPTDESEFSSYLITFSVDPPMDGPYEVRAILSQGGTTSQAAASFTLAEAQSSTADDAATEVASTAPLEIPARTDGSHGVTFTANAVQRPAAEEIKSILADAAKLAMNYRDTLPNFTCEQETSRSVDLHGDQHGSAQWQHEDTFTERLTYMDHEEHRVLLEHRQGGQMVNTGNGDLQGALLFGEFGNVITSLFRPSSKTEFEWKQAGVFGDGTVQVFDYRVARENSTFHLRTSAEQVATVGFHGQVFIDSATRNVRRVTEVVDDVPGKFPIHAASVSVDYDYVAINNHDYMLPVAAQVILRKGRKETDLNEIEFRNFRRFGSNMRILEPSQDAKP